MEKYKVLITYVEAGMGHIISAEAIANALEKYYPDEVEVERCRFFQETNDKLLTQHEQFLIDEVKKSNRHPFHMFYLKVLNLPLFPRLTSLKLTYTTLFFREKLHGISLLKRHDPDMVFSTHFTPLHFSIEANRRHYGCHFLSGLYIPDPNIHGWWDKRADVTVVNNPAGYEEAIKKNGFSPERTVLSKFILRDNVQKTPKDKRLLREKHGLPQDQFTVTMASGAYAEGRLPELAEAFLSIKRKFTLLIIAGSNEEVYNHFSEMIGHTGDIDLRVYHFVPDAHELYGASNLFVTKAGPNAILDSVYMDTPIMTNFYASIIEQITKELYVDQHQVGVYLKQTEEAVAFLESCIDDPSLLDPYVENCRSFIRDCTGGEKQIADAIVETLRKHGPPKKRKAE